MLKNEKENALLDEELKEQYNKTEVEAEKAEAEEEQYSLNDDRRVKTLSPSALVAKRFFRNRLAVTGLSILIFMFLFSFVGGFISPYAEDQLFYRYEEMSKEYAGVVKNEEFRFMAAEGASFNSVVQAQVVLAMRQNKTEFSYSGTDYQLVADSEDLYSVYSGGNLLGIAYKTSVTPSVADTKLSFDFQYSALKALAAGESSFEAEGTTYSLDKNGAVMLDGSEVASVSEYVIQAVMPDIFLDRQFKEEIINAIESGKDELEYVNGDTSVVYSIVYDATNNNWSVKQMVSTRVFDTYSAPSLKHPLGTDRNGMDMMTRLMYGGRVSLIIGFIVVFIETFIGVVLGGIAGYFGKWVDNLIMRIVDVFYCIPSMPIIIILGAMMDEMRVDPTIRMLYLMLILGILGWAGIARLVRGQILSLREQEFMVATEACGVRVSRRIFRHLIPNVIPQLIVFCTMGLGSTIITEATLSFLGLGVKFPFASWGNIINDVNDTFVLTEYLFIWVPAGVCLLLTVLAFNLVGDGLRDAFDPKMKR